MLTSLLNDTQGVIEHRSLQHTLHTQVATSSFSPDSAYRF